MNNPDSIFPPIYANGITKSGEYDLPPMTGAELAAFIQGQKSPENLAELRFRFRRATTRDLGVKEGIDPSKLAEAGWGVIFAHDADPAIKAALQPLLDLRKTQAGAHFRCYEQGDGYRPNESKDKWLTRHGIGPGPADPDKVPYYLLIVGSPAAIPYRFQSQLDVQYAVGRIHFETLQEYANYAQSVVDAETGKIKLPRQITLFSPDNNDDPSTKLSTHLLTEPLVTKLQEAKPDWQFTSFLRNDATHAELTQILGGDQTPALLFTASHGMVFPKGDALQERHQGALLCQDWPGREQWPHAIPEEFYFAGDHLASDRNLQGMIAFFFACYGGGTPLHDEFSEQAFQERTAIANRPFLAHLPNRMLSHPRGGALAVIGHVERAWTYSFLWANAGSQITTFEGTLHRLLAGLPVGLALEYFNGRYAELATLLSDDLEAIKFGDKPLDPYDLAGLWTANNDARGYAIIGDPAVRLPLVADGEAVARPVIQAIQVVGPAPPPDPTGGTTMPDPHEQPLDPAAPGKGNQGQAFSPLPTPPPGFKSEHPELYKAWVQHTATGYENNDEVFRRILQAFMRSYYSTLLMNWLLFGVGIGFFITGVLLARTAPTTGVLFGGLSVVAFLTYFVTRSTQAIEENLFYMTWLGVIYNSYWTHLAWSFDQQSAQQELEKTTSATITQVQQLIERHAKAVKERPGLIEVVTGRSQ